MRNAMASAPKWALGLLALGLAAVAFLVYAFLNPPTLQDFTEAGADATPGRTTAPVEEPPLVLVVGDGLTAGGGDRGWPALVTAAQDAAGAPVDIEVAAAAGVGYARVGADDFNFRGLVENAAGGYDVVVFFGSQSDNAAAEDVQNAAAAAFEAARAASPDAALVAIGPAWAGAAPPGYIVTNRDAVAAAASESDVTFVDPLELGWFSGPDAARLGVDGATLTPTGHQYLADRIGDLVQEALASVA